MRIFKLLIAILLMISVHTVTGQQAPQGQTSAGIAGNHLLDFSFQKKPVSRNWA